MDLNPEILDCNVRGLNDLAKRHAVREFVASTSVNLVCFQETKLDVIDEFTVLQCLGPSFDGFVYLPAVETRGGILLAWDSSVIEIDSFSFDTYSITGEVKTKDNVRWWITTVYGPQRDDDKISFMTELTERRSLCPGPWMVLGDFNLIMYASEKSNDNLDRAMMARFRRFAQCLELRDLYMHGRKFTWSNERESPTMTRIDRALVSIDWDLQYPDVLMQALSSTLSDHAPLHISLSAALRPKRRFRFELFWLKLEGFDHAVKEAWVCDQSIVDPFRRLDALFRNAAEALQAWGQKKMGNLKLKMAMANTIILRLDVAQEERVLSQGELWLRRVLKHTVLGLASLERTMARQRSRIR
jgi:exonuclease III